MKPTKLNKDPDFSVYNVGTDKIELTQSGLIGQLVPVECYIKTDGTKDNKPVLCFVLEDVYALRQQYFVAQISLKMFKPVIDQLIPHLESV